MPDGYEGDPLEWERLAGYFAGETSEGERRQVERWMAADPVRRQEMAELRRLWEQTGALPSSTRTDAMWTAVAREMRAPPAPRGPRAESGPPARAPRRWGGAGAVAASLLLALAAAVLWRAVAGPHAGEMATSQPLHPYRTEAGQWATIQLADGTRVELGPASVLRVRPFGEWGPRELELVGEAVFEVVHDARRPFLVRSAHAVTEDLGTRFQVRAYPGAADVRVAVMEGEVALRSRDAPAGSGTVLRPGQVGSLGTGGRVAVESGADPDSYLAWRAGRVVFRRATLRDVAVDLGHWYGVRIEIADPAIADRRITLDVPARSLTAVLDAATVPLGLRYERRGDTIALHP